MQFDDRLATVLRMRTDSEGGLRTQFQQLLDLIGTSPATADADLLERAYAKLRELGDGIPQYEQSAILRQGALRLRDVRLVSFLAEQDAKLAASAMATARLREAEWLAIIPELPVNARGFLRHRRDLSSKVRDLLARLGVQDLLLPDFAPKQRSAARPEGAERADSVAEPSIDPDVRDAVALTETATETATDTAVDADTAIDSDDAALTAKRPEEIGALLRRIAQFRETRRIRPVAPRLPLDDDTAQDPVRTIEFLTDADGTIYWADAPFGPLLSGMRLASVHLAQTVTIGAATRTALTARQPIRQAAISINTGSEISGEWYLDAAPLFDPQTSGFTGYRGCLRRPAQNLHAQAESEADKMRQVLHELRTPVNAIQGFAEIIQQQLFGAAPHEYRALAASVSVDAAKLMAGFDEVDRLVKLESGAMELAQGETDLAQCVTDTAQRLQTILHPRNAGIALSIDGAGFTVGLDRSEALLLIWRLLASIAAALSVGEEAELQLTSDGRQIVLDTTCPRAIFGRKSAKTAEPGRTRAISAGVFGPAFALRLAEAEATNAGGQLICKKNRIRLTLPALTGPLVDSSAGTGRTRR